ncbi:SH2 domain-containing protein 1B [Mustela nigripes]|uniref:SH2 domain containing 1B n=1 Tax=Mustela putorius furo TaxID=9669 RepID=M3XWX6_MUSPF|nr:SH2 domain-containing protein 1B [Mustela putorius furo]XP_032174410.1 SH2 domain-containing protein 1B [Mustela erminea]XP_059002110.1 SH2 domain-containing protein 1B [Mustela lutreola]XP_059270107.1 SH2 domain-containing protein 1B [Mustela nigripes]
MDYRAPSRLAVDLPYYHGPLSKKDCETLLLQDRVDGNFLIRDSESVPGVLCLCVSFKNFVYTYRIFKDGRGFYNIQTVEGAPQMLFSNLKELISTFEKPNQGLVVQLRHPIKQASSRPRWRRSQIQLDSIYENSNSDYVEVLP